MNGCNGCNNGNFDGSRYCWSPYQRMPSTRKWERRDTDKREGKIPSHCFIPCYGQLWCLRRRGSRHCGLLYQRLPSTRKQQLGVGELKIKSQLIWNSPQVQCSPEFHKTCLCIHRESFLPYTFQNQPAWCGHLCLVARYPILNPCRNIQTDLFWKVEKPMKSSLTSVLWTTRLKTKY